MEIARLEVSTQRHIERMQETAKVNLHSIWKEQEAKTQSWKILTTTVNSKC